MTSRIRGVVLLALLRSSDDEERAIGRDVVREAIAAHGSTVAAARALGVSARTLQRLCAHNPAMREGARGRGRPKKAAAP